MALNAAKASSPTLINAARASIDAQNYVSAEEYLKEIVRRREAHHEVAYLMSEVMAARNDKFEAIWWAMEAMRLSPGTLAYMDKFIELAGDEERTEFHPAINAAIEACLVHADNLPIWKLARLWTSNLYSRPDFRANYVEVPMLNTRVITDFRPVLNPYFLRGLQHIIAVSPPFEKFIAHLRRHVLEDAALGTSHLSSEEHLALGVTLAHYSFNCEYIIDYTTENEVQAVQSLREKVESAETVSSAEVVALACYAPLYKLKNAASIEKTYATHSALASLIKEQITDWNALVEDAMRIESVTSISTGVSENVRAQYEEFPYPRWDKIPVSSTKGWAAERAQLPFLKNACSGNFTALIAGCGTGQEPVSLALCAPQADILAVDLSRTSLAYSKMKAKEHGVSNITFRHGDILKLEEMGRQFDYIGSSGVLHHMENPLEGWRVLTKLLKPNGLMRIALYSKIARRHVLFAQEAARRNGYTGDRESMMAFRRDCPKNLPREVMQNITGFMDYYTMSMYRDLLFHVQERNYDLTEIAAMLDELGLKFEGFFVTERLKRVFKAVNPHAKDMLDLNDWHAFEQKSPNTFGHMYQFWCRKKA